MLFVILALGLGAGCESSPPPPTEYVARVGDAALTAGDLDAALAAVPAGVDSVTARQQVLEQWVTAELMALEAEDRGLRDQPDVQRQLVENERAVLAAALLTTLYDEETASFNRADLEAYFEHNRERLRLREPYVRVRIIEAPSADSAAAARRLMQQAMLTAQQDSLWREAAGYAVDTTMALALARSYVPESRLLAAGAPSAWAAFRQLGPGQISPVIEDDGTFYVLQLLDRVPAGSEPELDWIEDDVRRQVAIQARKQMLARHVQRLRSEAEARGELDIRGSTATPTRTP